ncbi:unknown [Prevotella sp. CAG:1320]|nr:unknown [Prevotella sp. CAG:1320]
MKKVMVILTMLLLVSINLSANNFQQQIELTYERRTPIGKPHDRSLQMDIEAFLDVPYLVFHSYMTEEQGGNISILNASGEKVMSETLLLSPYSETSLNIGDLPNGTYQLVIELEDAALYGTFLIL